jgi:hypothetical protein
MFSPNVFALCCSLADIETRLAQGLEPKQTQQEIEQALANKGQPRPAVAFFCPLFLTALLLFFFPPPQP